MRRANEKISINLEFEETYDEMSGLTYNKFNIHNFYGIDNFYFSKEEVRKWVEIKIDRTMSKYDIIKRI